MKLFRLSKEVYINLENVTEIQLTSRNVTFIHNGGHVKASVTSDEYTPEVKAWLTANGIDVKNPQASVASQQERPAAPSGFMPRVQQQQQSRPVLRAPQPQHESASPAADASSTDDLDEDSFHMK